MLFLLLMAKKECDGLFSLLLRSPPAVRRLMPLRRTREEEGHGIFKQASTSTAPADMQFDFQWADGQCIVCFLNYTLVDYGIEWV